MPILRHCCSFRSQERRADGHWWRWKERRKQKVRHLQPQSLQMLLLIICEALHPEEIEPRIAVNFGVTFDWTTLHFSLPRTDHFLRCPTMASLQWRRSLVAITADWKYHDLDRACDAFLVLCEDLSG
jgi:hypothetical protein